jgi:hypothetical protein
MTLYEFRLLSDDKQVEHLYNDGVYIGKRKDEDSSVVLYQLGNFYIEIYYLKYRSLISRLRCFTSTDALNPYLEQIDVEGLMYSVNFN